MKNFPQLASEDALRVTITVTYQPAVIHDDDVRALQTQLHAISPTILKPLPSGVGGAFEIAALTFQIVSTLADVTAVVQVVQSVWTRYQQWRMQDRQPVPHERAALIIERPDMTIYIPPVLPTDLPNPWTLVEAVFRELDQPPLADYMLDVVRVERDQQHPDQFRFWHVSGPAIPPYTQLYDRENQALVTYPRSRIP